MFIVQVTTLMWHSAFAFPLIFTREFQYAKCSGGKSQSTRDPMNECIMHHACCIVLYLDYIMTSNEGKACDLQHTEVSVLNVGVRLRQNKF